MDGPSGCELEERGSEERGSEERGSEERGSEERGSEERGLEERGLEERGLEESPMGGTRARARGAREIEARAALRPLGPDERPVALRVASAVALAFAVAVLVGTATVRDLSRHGGSIPAGIFIACIFIALAWGMYGRRYWAVLGFEAWLAFQIIVTSLALVVASTLLAACLSLLSIGLAGWLFWKLVRVMGRIQAGERADTPGGDSTDEALR
jgi:hypothetical protein